MLFDVILFFAGIVVGGMNAVAGGGTLVGFPVMLAIGVPALSANATMHLAILPGTLSSSYGYRKFIRKVPKRYALLVVPCVIGGIVGSLALRYTPSARFEEIVPGLILVAVALFAFQPLIHFHLHRHMSSKKQDLQTLLIIGLALLPVAVYGGYFGAGFGFIMLAFLGFTKLHDIHKMNGLKNLASSSISVASIICLLGSNLINWRDGLIMSAGTFAGGYYASVLAQKVSTHAIRVLVIVIGLATAAYLGLRTY